MGSSTGNWNAFVILWSFIVFQFVAFLSAPSFNPETLKGCVQSLSLSYLNAALHVFDGCSTVCWRTLEGEPRSLPVHLQFILQGCNGFIIQVHKPDLLQKASSISEALTIDLCSCTKRAAS